MDEGQLDYCDKFEEAVDVIKMDEAQRDYYDKLTDEVDVKLQGKHKAYKKTGEKAMTYIKDSEKRRNTYRDRSKTIIQKVSPKKFKISIVGICIHRACILT